MNYSQKEIDEILDQLSEGDSNGNDSLTIDEVDRLIKQFDPKASYRESLPSEEDSFEVFCMKIRDSKGTEPDFRESWNTWVGIQKWKHFDGLNKLQVQLEGILLDASISGKKKNLAIMEAVRGSVFPSLKAGEGVSETLRHHIELYVVSAYEHFYGSEKNCKKTFLDMDDLLAWSMNEEESNYAYMINWLFWRVKEIPKRNEARQEPSDL